MIIRSFHDADSGSCTYVLADLERNVAGVIDPVEELTDAVCGLLERFDLELEFALETHLHLDHRSSGFELRRRYRCQYLVPRGMGVHGVDDDLHDGQGLRLGGTLLRVLSTPGQSPHAVSVFAPVGPGVVFTGDLLLCGEVGLPDSWPCDVHRQFGAIRSQLFRLGDDVRVLPAHTVRPAQFSTIEAERTTNPFVRQSLAFADFEAALAQRARRPHYTLAGAEEHNLGLARVSSLSSHRNSRGLVRLQALAGPSTITRDELAGLRRDAAVLDFRPKVTVRGASDPAAVHVTAESVAEATRGWDRSRPVALLHAAARELAAVQRLQFERVYLLVDDDIARLTANLLSQLPLPAPERRLQRTVA